jgi:uncharacterized damage-inducible protein DinB
MIESTLTLASIYKGWDHHHHQLLEAVRPLSVDQLAGCAAPQLRSIRELVAHMIAVRARCFYYVFQENRATLADLVTWDQGDAPERSTLELLDGLDLTWQVLQGGLARWRPPDLEDILHIEREGMVSTRSRQWVIWHMLEHDLHHAGELFLTLGMYGLVGLDL